MKGGTGEEKRDATLRHVLCGECEGVPEETRQGTRQGWGHEVGVPVQEADITIRK